MYVVNGYKHKEIAEELGISISTSKTNYMKARKIVAKKFNQQIKTL